MEDGFVERNSSAELLRDPRFYLESFTRIKSEKEGLVPFMLSPLQLHIFNLIFEHEKLCLVKARQLGSSSAIAGLIYHHAITTPGVTSAIIAHTAKAASELLDKIKTMWRTSPQSVRPELGMNSKFELSIPKMESKIIVLPATEDLGRSYSFNGIVLASEFPFWPKPDEQLSALLPAVHGKLVIESSPSMVGDAFHRLWCADNDFHKEMLGWWWKYNREEFESMRRNQPDENRFLREYCCMFMSTGANVFDTQTISLQRDNVRRIGDELETGQGFKWKVQRVDNLPVPGCDAVDGLIVFRPPVADGVYVVGGDVAAGYEEGNFSVASVLDRRTGEQVGFWRGQVAPSRFGEVLYAIGAYYNHALMIPEINNHGISVLDRLKQLCYPNMYFRPKGMETPGESVSDRLGWKTGPSTRSFLINDFRTACKKGEITIRSKETYDEMTTFIYDRFGRECAIAGTKDDSVFATAIALQGFKMTWTEDPGQIDLSNLMPRSGY